MSSASQQHEKTHFAYTIDAYKKDISAVIGSDLSPAQRGAVFAAASKRYKQEIILWYLDFVVAKEKIDLTPTLANNLINGWIGRSVSRAVLSKLFATPERTAAQKSQDDVKIPDLVTQYQATVQEALKKACTEMAKVRKKLGC